jgi:hypothetical protein
MSDLLTMMWKESKDMFLGEEGMDIPVFLIGILVFISHCSPGFNGQALTLAIAIFDSFLRYH